MEKYFQGVRWLNMYIYQLTYEDEGSLLMIGYFGSWKKARSVMKNIDQHFQDLKNIRIVLL